MPQRSSPQRRYAACAALFALACAGLVCATGHAANYPAKPVRIIVPQPAGGNSDIVARAYAQRLTDRFGVQFVIDNRGGGGGVIATELTVHAPPDGYTLLLGVTSIGTNPALIANLPFDTRRDLAPISLLSTGPNIVVVGAGSALRTVGEIIAAARAQPGKLNYSSSGIANSTHMSGELFKYMAKVDILHVPYKGAPASMVAVSGGEVDMAFSGMSGALPLIRGGKLRAIAVTSAKRWPTLTEVPAIAEGVPGYESTNWYAMFAPARLPPRLVNLLHGQLAAITQDPEMRSRSLADGQEPLGTTPKELEQHLAREIAKWITLAKVASLSIN